MTSKPIELLVTVARGDRRRFGVQIEDQIRHAIRAGRLGSGSALPSTRDLARQLGVSRPIVVQAYAQLAAEGYVVVRQGTRPHVSESVGRVEQRSPIRHRPSPPPRYDFRPSTPDLSAFPRGAWLKAARQALAKLPHDNLGYSEPHGSGALRVALAEYLGRVRGIVTDPDRIVITSGYAQGRVLVCRALRALGIRTIAVEDPSYRDWDAVTQAGLERVPVPVDESGMRTDVLERTAAQAVLVTPAHQFPTGVVLSGERRAELLIWLRDREAIAFEDDYDAEYRYDRPPVGALHAMEPERVVYAGTASKALAPGLRMGWLVLPQSLLAPVQAQQRMADFGCPRIEQHTLAEFIKNGSLDLHLRRTRGRYRERRKALVEALAAELPEAKVHGIAAGIHAAVQLLPEDDEAMILREAAPRGIAFETMAECCVQSRHPATLLLGYAHSSTATIWNGVRELAAAVRAARKAARTLHRRNQL